MASNSSAPSTMAGEPPPNNAHDHVSMETFSASEHLCYVPPARVHTLTDLGLPNSPISPIGSTDPFPLLTPAAVEAHRRELFSSEVLENCLFVTRKGSCQLRGMAPRYAPFINLFWKSKEVLDIVSRLAGVELVPVVDHEICHTNIQLGPGGIEGVRQTPVVPPAATDEALQELDAYNRQREVEVAEDDNPDRKIVPWHRDSHPFVCVVMLSDTRCMTGGETELMKGDGTTLKVRSPQIGGAVVLQGRHVSHLAHPAVNMPERITIVTSFRPRDPRLFDDSSQMNVRKQSRLPEMYYQWTRYRLKLLSERFKFEQEALEQRYEGVVARKGEAVRGSNDEMVVDVEQLTEWMEGQMRYMKKTVFEMRPLTDEDWIIKNTLEDGLVM